MKKSIIPARIVFRSLADFSVFHLVGATRCSDQREIWHGGADRSTKIEYVCRIIHMQHNKSILFSKACHLKIQYSLILRVINLLGARRQFGGNCPRAVPNKVLKLRTFLLNVCACRILRTVVALLFRQSLQYIVRVQLIRLYYRITRVL